MKNKTYTIGKASHGFTLLEVIIAMFLLTVGAGGAFMLIQRMVAFSAENVNKLTASYLAQEGVELVRNIRDSNFLKQYSGAGGAWNDGLTACEAGCEIDYNDTGLVSYSGQPLKMNGSFYGYDAGEGTHFKRKITIAQAGADTLKIQVEVFWEDRGFTRSVDGSSELYNWLSM